MTPSHLCQTTTNIGLYYHSVSQLSRATLSIIICVVKTLSTKHFGSNVAKVYDLIKDTISAM